MPAARQRLVGIHATRLGCEASSGRAPPPRPRHASRATPPGVPRQTVAAAATTLPAGPRSPSTLNDKQGGGRQSPPRRPPARRRAHRSARVSGPAAGGRGPAETRVGGMPSSTRGRPHRGGRGPLARSAPTRSAGRRRAPRGGGARGVGARARARFRLASRGGGGLVSSIETCASAVKSRSCSCQILRFRSKAWKMHQSNDAIQIPYILSAKYKVACLCFHIPSERTGLSICCFFPMRRRQGTNRPDCGRYVGIDEALLHHPHCRGGCGWRRAVHPTAYAPALPPPVPLIVRLGQGEFILYSSPEWS